MIRSSFEAERQDFWNGSQMRLKERIVKQSDFWRSLEQPGAGGLCWILFVRVCRARGVRQSANVTVQMVVSCEDNPTQRSDKIRVLAGQDELDINSVLVFKRSSRPSQALKVKLVKPGILDQTIGQAEVAVKTLAQGSPGVKELHLSLTDSNGVERGEVKMIVELKGMSQYELNSMNPVVLYEPASPSTEGLRSTGNISADAVLSDLMEVPQQAACPGCGTLNECIFPGQECDIQCGACGLIFTMRKPTRRTNELDMMIGVLEAYLATTDEPDTTRPSAANQHRSRQATTSKQRSPKERKATNAARQELAKATAPVLKRGMEVLVSGVKDSDDLNGCRGILLEYVVDPPRWRVALDSHDHIQSLRPENLFIVAHDQDATPTKVTLKKGVQAKPPSGGTVPFYEASI